MKTGLIYQPCGLGDILFLQKLAYSIQDLGYDVVWPVIHEFEWLGDYIPSFKFISWGDNDKKITGPPLPESCQFPYKERYIHGAPTEILDDLFFFQGFDDYKPIMAGKYESVGIDWRDWRDYVHFNRNIDRENELFYNVLELKDDDEFVYVNRLWCTRPKLEIYPHISVNPDDYGCKVVENEIISGFTLFDWCKVFERAREIHMVETAINYVLESPQLFSTIAQKPLYLRHRWGNYSEVAYLHKLPWRYL